MISAGTTFDITVSCVPSSPIPPSTAPPAIIAGIAVITAAITPDGDGSLLDHSIILFGSNMSNSDRHNNDPLPSAVFGKGYGKIKGGQHLKYPQNTPHANLLLTLLERAGVPVEKIGDSTGTFAEI